MHISSTNQNVNKPDKLSPITFRFAFSQSENFLSATWGNPHGRNSLKPPIPCSSTLSHELILMFPAHTFINSSRIIVYLFIHRFLIQLPILQFITNSLYSLIHFSSSCIFLLHSLPLPILYNIFTTYCFFSIIFSYPHSFPPYVLQFITPFLSLQHPNLSIGFSILIPAIPSL